MSCLLKSLPSTNTSRTRDLKLCMPVLLERIYATRTSPVLMSSARFCGAISEAVDAFRISFRPHRDDGILTRSRPIERWKCCGSRRGRAKGDGLCSTLAVTSPHVIPLHAALIHEAMGVQEGFTSGMCSTTLAVETSRQMGLDAPLFALPLRRVCESELRRPKHGHCSVQSPSWIRQMWS